MPALNLKVFHITPSLILPLTETRIEKKFIAEEKLFKLLPLHHSSRYISHFLFHFHVKAEKKKKPVLPTFTCDLGNSDEQDLALPKWVQLHHGVIILGAF